MKRAAVFFDRDNTLIANDGYLGDPNGVALVEGAADAVARARSLGYAVVVFSNQSGVARGMFTEEAVHSVNHRLDEMLLDDNPHAVIDRHEFCPYHPDATVERYKQDSDLRKPKPGMILQAERQLALDLARSWVVGDAPRDVDAGKAVGCRAILVKNTSLADSPAAKEPGHSHPDYVVESLAEAMEVIARHPAPKEEPVSAAPVIEPTALETAEAVAPAIGAEAASPTTRSDDEPPAVAPTSAMHIAPTPVEAPRSKVEDEHEDGEEDEPARRKSREEVLLGQILDEMKRRHEHPEADFSVSKLMAGVVQVLALAAVISAYGKDSAAAALHLLVGIYLQAFTIALLIMGKQK